MNRKEFIAGLSLAGLQSALGADKDIAKVAQRTSPFDPTKKISYLGLGANRLPMVDGRVEMEKVSAYVDYAMSHGINYYDTAWTYCQGQGETLSAVAVCHTR